MSTSESPFHSQKSLHYLKLAIKQNEKGKIIRGLRIKGGSTNPFFGGKKIALLLERKACWVKFQRVAELQDYL